MPLPRLVLNKPLHLHSGRPGRCRQGWRRTAARRRDRAPVAGTDASGRGGSRAGAV